MSKKLIRTPRGTHDLAGMDQLLHQEVLNKGRKTLQNYGFEEWQTPIFEDSALFLRTLGDSSDIVSKEMYLFEDKGGDTLTLRPEGTAPICRSFLEQGLTQALPQRVFYHGSMFRYERPQKGRFREFRQFGAEFIGVEGPWRDAEIIKMASDFLKSLGLLDIVSLEINTLGDLESRQNWRKALVEYFTEFKDALSEDSQNRLLVNPLRILDSKSEKDKLLLADAPSAHEYLNEDSKKFWSELCEALDYFGVEYRVNPSIVRGLDYYSHTAFEFVTDALGAQNTVLGGGRYEGLIEELGGPSIPAIGWAAGVERLVEILKERQAVKPKPYIAVLPTTEKELPESARVASLLRDSGWAVKIDAKGRIKKRLSRVLSDHCRFVIFLGEEEISEQKIRLRDLKTREEILLSQEMLPEHLEKLSSKD
ncbi:histidine--tRNA ligase [Acetobacteraceae bacterium]|nr:histidine--tRNA ligase [Acetobacteraceae bacterium]